MRRNVRPKSRFCIRTRRARLRLPSFDTMNLPTKRSQRIDAYISDASHEVPDEKVRVMLAGDVHTLKVYRIPISHLIFNIRNGRFRAELLAKEEQLKRRLDPTVETDAKIIRELLLSQDEGEGLPAALKDVPEVVAM